MAMPIEFINRLRELRKQQRKGKIGYLGSLELAAMELKQRSVNRARHNANREARRNK